MVILTVTLVFAFSFMHPCTLGGVVGRKVNSCEIYVKNGSESPLMPVCSHSFPCAHLYPCVHSYPFVSLQLAIWRKFIEFQNFQNQNVFQDIQSNSGFLTSRPLTLARACSRTLMSKPLSI